MVELLSTVIEHLVKGEVMQMRGGHLKVRRCSCTRCCNRCFVSCRYSPSSLLRHVPKDCGPLEYYFHKNYYKTGSLMANSCRAASVLGAHPASVNSLLHPL